MTIMCRTLLAFLLVSCAWRECQSVMCYWCSGVGDDRECETRPYAVQTGPVYLNCRANFCLSAKVIDAETGQVQSFARLCDNVPRGNLCIRDSKLLTCYESCTSDLCNNGNPSPLQLPTVSYAGENLTPDRYKSGYNPIQTSDTLGRPYKSNSLKGARNIRFGPRRDMWMATRQHGYLSTRARRFPFIVTSTTPGPKSHDFRSGKSSSEYLKAGMRKNAEGKNLEMLVEKNTMNREFNTVHPGAGPELSENHITSNPGAKHSPLSDNMKTTLPVTINKDRNIPVVDRPKHAGGVEREFDASKEVIHEEPVDYSASMMEERGNPRTRGDSANDYLATMDIGYGDNDDNNNNNNNNRQVVKQKKAKNDLQYIDEDDSEVFYEEEFEVDQFGEVGRGSDGMVIWPRRAIEEEIEREEMRREDEVPVSNLIVEEDREEGLIQTFRANTTKTTENADKIGAKESEKNDAKSVVADATKVSADAVESHAVGQKEGTTATTGTARNDVTTTEKIRITTTQRNKKEIKNMRVTGNKSKLATVVTAPLPVTTTTVTKSTPKSKTLTTLRKRKMTIPLTQTGTKQTTLPYIWRETSAWDEDSTFTDKTNGKHSRTTKSRNTDKATTIKHTRKSSRHRNVHLTDFLELQSTTEPVNISVSTNFSVTGQLTNQTSLAQKALANSEEGAIYLDESLTENLLGLKEDLQDETEAELTGSHSPATSGVGWFLILTLIAVNWYLL